MNNLELPTTDTLNELTPEQLREAHREARIIARALKQADAIGQKLANGTYIVTSQPNQWLIDLQNQINTKEVNTRGNLSN